MRTVQIIADGDDEIGLRMATEPLRQFFQRNTAYPRRPFEISIIAHRITRLRQSQQIFPPQVSDCSCRHSGQISGYLQIESGSAFFVELGSHNVCSLRLCLGVRDVRYSSKRQSQKKQTETTGAGLKN